MDGEIVADQNNGNNNPQGNAGENVVPNPNPTVQPAAQSVQSVLIAPASVPGIEKLEGERNYNVWKWQMKMLLIDYGMWDSVTGVDTDPIRDRRALAKISLAIKPVCASHIYKSTTSKEAWDALQKAFGSSGLTRELMLERQLMRVRYEDYASMSEYINGILSIVNQLADIGVDIPDNKVGKILLSGLSDSFETLVQGFGSTHTEVRSEEVRTLLMEEDCRRTASQCEASLASVKLKSSNSHASNSNSNKNSNNTACSNDKIICHYCKKEGHKRPHCQKCKKLKKQNASSQDGPQDGKQSSNGIVLLTATAFSGAEMPRDHWFFDSGGSQHLTSRGDWVKDLDTSVNTKILTANSSVMSCQGVGNVPFSTTNNHGVIKDVLYCTQSAANLLSVCKIAEKGKVLVFDRFGVNVFDENQVNITGTSQLTGSVSNGIYKLDKDGKTSATTYDKISAMASVLPVTVNSTEGNVAEIPKNVSSDGNASSLAPTLNVESMLLNVSTVPEELWHRRTGHLNYKYLSKLKDLANGIKFVEGQHKDCIPCIQGKHCRKPFQHTAQKASDLLERIHSDVCYPEKGIVTWGGARYLVTFTDDFSRKSFGYLIKTKDEVFSKFKEFKLLVEKQTGKVIKYLRTDGGGEYVNGRMADFLKANGITHETTCPDTPEQGGLSERAGRTIFDCARTMLCDSGLDKRYWGEAVCTAIYLKNRSPTAALDYQIPETIWSGKKVDLSHLRVFGCRAFMFIPKKKRGKLDPKSKEVIMLGYCPGKKGYRLGDLHEPKKLYNSRDVKFIESQMSGSTVPDVDSKETDNVEQGDCVIVSEGNVENVQPDSIVPENESLISENADLSDYYDSDIVVQHDNALNETPERPVRARQPPRWHADYDMSFQALTDMTDHIPKSTKDALLDPMWKMAMESEYNSLLKHNVWELVDRPADCNIVKSKWVFRRKSDCSGEFTKYKARLVARWFSQKYGIDFHETFSPVVSYTTLRLLFAYANEMDLDIEHADVATAFLNADLTEKIYMEQPEGFSLPGKVCLLRKSIYGLKQSSRMWNETIPKVMIQAGFKQLKCEPCVYVCHKGDNITIAALYVDDVYTFSNCAQDKQRLYDFLCRNFDVKLLGNVRDCLGMRVTRHRDKGVIALDQAQYVKRLLDKFSMNDLKSSATPMAVGVELTKATYLSFMKTGEVPYQELIGGLMFLAINSRPDIAFAVNKLSQFNTAYDQSHWTAVKRVMRYLMGTVDYGLVYTKSGNINVNAYVDASYGGSPGDRFSHTGFVMQLGNSTFSWESIKQKTVVLSSTEAEYVAFTNVVKEACFVNNLSTELSLNLGTIKIYNDNLSAQYMVGSKQTRKRSKHIDIKHHFVKDVMLRGIVSFEFKPTSDLIADVLTKPLCKEKHVSFINGMNVLNVHDA